MTLCKVKNNITLVIESGTLIKGGSLIELTDEQVLMFVNDIEPVQLVNEPEIVEEKTEDESKNHKKTSNRNK